MPTTLIRSARVIDPASGTDAVQDIAIDGGFVAAIGPNLDTGSAERVIDAEGLIATPGLIDPHVHLREPGGSHKETIEGGTRAAADGGFATVCCMPNTVPALDTPELMECITAKSADVASTRVFPVCCGTVGRKGEQLAEVGLCARAGAVAVSDDGDVIASAGMMARVLKAAADAGLVFMQHCQEPTLTQGASMHAGSVSTRLGLTGWPRVAEEMIIDRDVRLVQTVEGSRYHAQHLSSGGSVEIIKRARDRGLAVSAEVSPHHLTLTHEAVAGVDGHAFDTAAKMNPPLREQRDVEQLRQAVADGVITVLATDHAPHAAEEKDRPFEDAPFGILGLETALPLYVEALVETGAIDWPRLIELITIEPARLCGLDAKGLGKLAVGGPADVTLIDPDLAWTLTESECAGTAANTPFLGRPLKGRAVATFVAGVARLDRLAVRSA